MAWFKRRRQRKALIRAARVLLALDELSAR
jgi:hypothetical protein